MAEQGNTLEMNVLICNKCFVTIYREERPFHITQCGHLFCQTCLQQAEKQCPQCGHVSTAVFLELEEPLIPQLAPYFQPFSETREMLLKVDAFRINQWKIMMQRFYDLDKKYEELKAVYWQEQRKMKILMEEYMELESYVDEINEHFCRMLGESMMGQTPSDSGISTPSTRYSMESELGRSANVTPPMSDS